MGSLSLDRYHFDFLMILKETLTISVDIKSGSTVPLILVLAVCFLHSLGMSVRRLLFLQTQRQLGRHQQRGGAGTATRLTSVSTRLNTRPSLGPSLSPTSVRTLPAGREHYHLVRSVCFSTLNGDGAATVFVLVIIILVHFIDHCYDLLFITYYY